MVQILCENWLEMKLRICVRFASTFNVERVAVLTYDLVICKDSNDCLHQCMLIYVDFLVDNPVEQRQAGFCSSLFQQWPIQVLQHACDTLMSAVLVAYETGCSTLNCFQELNVVLCVWIPYWSCVFHLGPEDRLVNHILYLSRAVFEVSTHDSQVFDLPLRQSSSHGCSTLDLIKNSDSVENISEKKLIFFSCDFDIFYGSIGCATKFYAVEISFFFLSLFDQKL